MTPPVAVALLPKASALRLANQQRICRQVCVTLAGHVPPSLHPLHQLSVLTSWLELGDRLMQLSSLSLVWDQVARMSDAPSPASSECSPSACSSLRMAFFQMDTLGTVRLRHRISTDVGGIWRRIPLCLCSNPIESQIPTVQLITGTWILRLLLSLTSAMATSPHSA
eukprot:5606249-Amphidinium_carterae.1